MQLEQRLILFLCEHHVGQEVVEWCLRRQLFPQHLQANNVTSIGMGMARKKDALTRKERKTNLPVPS